jgi:type VI secretion system secreted protein Hcp
MATNYLTFANPGIPGSSTSPGHVGEIEVLSWSHGFVQPTSPTRGTAGTGTVEQATHQNLSFTKYSDSSSDLLRQTCYSGQQIGQATLTCYRADGAGSNTPVLYLTVTMTNVIISNCSVAAGPGDVPVENITLDYGTVNYNYVEQK